MTEYLDPEDILQKASSRYLDRVSFNESIQQIKKNALADLDSKIRELHEPVTHPSGTTYCAICFKDDGQNDSIAEKYPCPTVQILEKVKQNG